MRSAGFTTGAPPLTVALSVYNNAPYVGEAVESILNQTFGAFEFLIVNDGSTDGSAEIIEGYAARDSRIRVLHQENRGFVASLNRMLEEARAPLIARMDGDDISLPTRFERQLAFLDAHPDHGVIGTYALSIDDHGRRMIDSDRPKPLTHDELVASFGEGPLLNHNAVIYRRDIVRSVGGYRTAYRHCEDFDLWLRLAPHTRMANLPEPLILYRRYSSQVSNRHLVEQAVNAGIAYIAYRERGAGRPDPTDGLAALPAVADLDALFNRPGCTRMVREHAVGSYLYSLEALANEGYPLLIDHVREGAGTIRKALWRAALRLARHGHFRRAGGLALALARG